MIVVSSPARAEQLLVDGDIPCPTCRGVLRPHGHGRTRTVRGMGAARVTVTPRRARCGDCRATQVLLPTALTSRLADATEVVGNALLAKANGAGCRTIASALGRPESTVRRWLRRARGEHAEWLYQQGVEQAIVFDGELLGRPGKPHKTMLGEALNLLAGAALRFRECLKVTDPIWSLIAILARGRLLAARPIT